MSSISYAAGRQRSAKWLLKTKKIIKSNRLKLGTSTVYTLYSGLCFGIKYFSCETVLVYLSFSAFCFLVAKWLHHPEL